MIGLMRLCKKVRLMIKCKFSDVSERDMDLLFLEEFVCSPRFLEIFLSKIGLKNATVVEVEQSKVDVAYGESDMTVIIESNGKRIGLLIEDKIDAIAMPNQSGRYNKRGNIGIAKGDYQDFFVFIVAPKNYLSINDEAQKYPNKVTYEECLEYFLMQDDERSAYKAQQIEQAICKQKQGYQVVEHKAITAFWRSYILYQKKMYPHFVFRDALGPKGAKATWVMFHTYFKNVKILHKTEKGFVDMEFAGLASKTTELKDLLLEATGENTGKIRVCQTGKSAVYRVRVPVIDFKQNFLNFQKEVEEALAAIDSLYNLLAIIPSYKIDNIFED